MTVTKDNTVIENLNLSGSIRINADNVTIRNTKISTGTYWPLYAYDGTTGTTIEDVTVVGSGSAQACVLGGRMTVRRMNCSGAHDGLKLNSHSVLTDSYIHDLSGGADAHNDGVEVNDWNVDVIHNTVLNSRSQTSAVLIGSGMQNVRLSDNYLSGGGYTVYGGAEGGKNIDITNNKFGTEFFARSGHYGPAAYVAEDSASTWSGNAYANGTAVLP